MTPEIPPPSSANEAPAPETEVAPDAVTTPEYQGPTWEDDETRATLVLRALFALLATGFLAYAQWRAPENFVGAIGANWGRWVWISVVFNFVLPLGIVWLFFGQSVRRVAYLKNQALNAWNYGWNFRMPRDENAPSFLSRVLASPLLSGIALCVVVVPLLLFAARESGVGATLFPLNASTRAWWFPLAILVAFCREWFFRGFLLFGIAQGFRGIAAPIVAIFVQAALFAAALGANSGGAFFDAANVSLFCVGLLLGAVAWRQKSFAAPFVAHAVALFAAALLLR